MYRGNSMAIADVVKPVGDVVATGVTFGTLLAVIPPIAALFAILYYVIVLVEKLTGKTLHDLITEWRKHD